MPITSSAKKALRTSQSHFEANQRVRSQMKTAIKRFQESPTPENLAKAFSRIDRAAKGNIIHARTAARRKSNLTKALEAASAK